MNYKKTLLIPIALCAFALASCNTNNVERRHVDPIRTDKSDTSRTLTSLYSFGSYNSVNSNQIDRFSITVYSASTGNFIIDDPAYDKYHCEVEQFQPIRLMFEIPSRYTANQWTVSLNDDSPYFEYVFNYIEDNRIFYTAYPIKAFEEQYIKMTFDTVYYLDVKSNEYTPNSSKDSIIRRLNTSYTPLRDMAESVTYHQFVNPYPGIDLNNRRFSVSGSSYWNEYSLGYLFENEYDLGYVPYLTDSIYYPRVMEMGTGDIASRSMKMYYAGQPLIQSGSTRSEIPCFQITYGVLDADCTHPSNPILYLAYTAVSKNTIAGSGPLNDIMSHYQHLAPYMARNTNQEWFYSMELNDVTISFFEDDSEIIGFFEDSTYLYFLGCSMERG